LGSFFVNLTLTNDMKHLRFTAHLSFACLMAMLFMAAPAQAENPALSACVAASEMDFSGLSLGSLEASEFLSVAPFKVDAEMNEMAVFEEMANANLEQERFWRRLLKWICKGSTQVSTWLSGDEEGHEGRMEGCEERWGPED